VKSWARPLIGWAALVLGIGGIVASLAFTSTRAGEGLTFGFAAFIAFFGLLSLLVRKPTPDHWVLFVSGFVLFLLPWLGAGFAPDLGAAWTAWVVGCVAMTLGAIGWLNDKPPTVTGINENTSSLNRSEFDAGIRLGCSLNRARRGGVARDARSKFMAPMSNAPVTPPTSSENLTFMSNWTSGGHFT
jgi:hypothetical protein